MNVKFYLSETHACGHIRGEVPARAINALRPDCRVDCKTDILCSDFYKTDLMVFQRSHSLDVYNKMMIAKSMGIKTVYEIDDDMLNMPREFAKPYEFYSKPEVREAMLRFLQDCDAVTVSTEALAASLRKCTPRPVLVVPNAIDLDRWRDAQLARDANLEKHNGVSRPPGDRIHIGWMASGSHQIDLPLVDRALCDILRDNANVWIRVIGTLAPEHLKPYELSKFLDRMPFSDWTEINALPGVMADFDLAIAPLVDTPFNRGKSGIKWMQYCALGIPGVYSDLSMYRDVCTDGSDGFLVQPGGWKEPLEALVKDAKLRRQVGISGLQHVQKWDINRTAGAWVSAWRQVMTLTS